MEQKLTPTLPDSNYQPGSQQSELNLRNQSDSLPLTALSIDSQSIQKSREKQNQQIKIHLQQYDSLTYKQMPEDERHEYESYQIEQQNAGFSPAQKYDSTEADRLSNLMRKQNPALRQSPIIYENQTKKFSLQVRTQQKLIKTEVQLKTNSFAFYQNEGQLKQSTAASKMENIKQLKQLPAKQIKQLPVKQTKKQLKIQTHAFQIINADSVVGEKTQQTEKTKELIKKDQTQADQVLRQSPNNQKQNKSSDLSNNFIQQGPEGKAQNTSQIVSEIVLPTTGTIIFEAQRERIGSTLEYFLKYTEMHEKHTQNQKQLINNIEQEIQKKCIGKHSIFNTLRDYFNNFSKLCKQFYEQGYKFSRNETEMSINPMINMKEELRGLFDELICLRKNTGSEFNRLGEFVSANCAKNVTKLFLDYWKTNETSRNKYDEKKTEFYKKEKQFMKRISKVIKVYIKGKQGSSLEEDLFIQMAKFIKQEKQYRSFLIEYGLELIPLKRVFIKTEESLYEELQLIFNSFKNQSRFLYCIYPRQFHLIQKMDNLIKQNNTFEKLADITDGDYVRSVLLTFEKNSIQNLTDKEFQKVLKMLHFENVVGNSVHLLKGTTTKSFDLKDQAEQLIDTVSGNLLIINKETSQMRQKFIMKNINARIVQDSIVEIDQVLKGIIFDSHRSLRIAFRDNDRAEELICFLNQVNENAKEKQQAQNQK